MENWERASARTRLMVFRCFIGHSLLLSGRIACRRYTEEDGGGLVGPPPTGFCGFLLTKRGIVMASRSSAKGNLSPAPFCAAAGHRVNGCNRVTMLCPRFLVFRGREYLQQLQQEGQLDLGGDTLDGAGRGYVS